MNPLNLRSPFFRPRWRRAVAVAVPAAWALVELSSGNTFWAVLFAGIAAYAAYELFIAYDPANYADEPKDRP